MGIWIGGGLITYQAIRQTSLRRYPPFIKDVIDEGIAHSINWKSFQIKIIFAAETFSEKFREHIMTSTGITDPYRHIMNIYGTADLGTMAIETPLSILLRKLALADSASAATEHIVLVVGFQNPSYWLNSIK